MLAEGFYWLLSMSIVGTLVGAVVWLIRCIPRIPRRVTVWLWGFVFCRLVVPVSFGGRFGLMALVSKFFSKTIEVYADDRWSLTITNTVQGAESYFPVTYKSLWVSTIFHVASVIWMIVAILLLVVITIQYVQTAHLLSDAKPIKNGVWCSSSVDSPMVFGILCPKIVVPPTDGEIERFVLLHEQTHIRRKDNLWRLLAIITAVIHWFNPFVWWFLRCFLSDLEMACDESVLASCEEEERTAYAKALLDAARTRAQMFSPFGGAPLRTRILRVLSYRKLSVLSLIGCVLLIVSMAYVLLTNAT